MAINLVVVALFVVNVWMRLRGADPRGTPMLLSGVALVMLVVSGWLGGKMVYEYGVGVDAPPVPPVTLR